MWFTCSLFATGIFCLWLGILSVFLDWQNNESFFLGSLLAGTSGVLLAASLSLSSFAYYFNFLDKKVVYRKYLGLLGYFFALAYTLLIVFGNPVLYFFSFPYNLFEPTIGLGFLAMVIFTLMALVSNQKAVQILGGKNWKTLLGLGYIAYAFLVIRAILLDGSTWESFLLGETNTFTVRMFLTILGTLVLIFRASVPFHQKFTVIQ